MKLLVGPSPCSAGRYPGPGTNPGNKEGGKDMVGLAQSRGDTSGATYFIPAVVG